MITKLSCRIFPISRFNYFPSKGNLLVMASHSFCFPGEIKWVLVRDANSFQVSKAFYVLFVNVSDEQMH